MIIIIAVPQSFSKQGFRKYIKDDDDYDYDNDDNDHISYLITSSDQLNKTFSAHNASIFAQCEKLWDEQSMEL